MGTYVALFRGINVGGRNVLPMKELAAALEPLGCRNVATYIQSGNAVFESRAQDGGRLAKRIAAEIRARRGFEPHVILLDAADVARAVRRNPYPEAEATPQYLHVGFLAGTPRGFDTDALERLRRPDERYRVSGRVFYLHAPRGIGASKLAAGAEKILGVPMTLRNWSTVSRLLEMARKSGGHGAA
jgi:uncharacterized protein (DUF1697 family)